MKQEDLLQEFRDKTLRLSIRMTLFVVLVAFCLHLCIYNLSLIHTLIVLDLSAILLLTLSYFLIVRDIRTWFHPVLILNYIMLIFLVAMIYREGLNPLVIIWYPPISMSAMILGGLRNGILLTLFTLVVALYLTYGNPTNIEISILLSIGGAGLFGAIIHSALTKFAGENETLKSRFYQLANRDMLTGLNNRRHFFEQCQAIYELARRKGKYLTLIYIDLDNFKWINDTYGHTKGDEILIKFAKLLRDSIRVYDTTGRIGGEEFVVCLYDTSPEQATLIAEKLRKNTQKILIDTEHHLTASFGVYTFPPAGEGAPRLHEALKYADLAMYQAKHQGKNRVEICCQNQNSKSSVVTEETHQ